MHQGTPDPDIFTFVQGSLPSAVFSSQSGNWTMPQGLQKIVGVGPEDSMLLENLNHFQLISGTSLADQSFTTLFGSFDESSKVFSTASNPAEANGILVIFDADSSSSVNASAVWVTLNEPLSLDFDTPHTIKFHSIMG